MDVIYDALKLAETDQELLDDPEILFSSLKKTVPTVDLDQDHSVLAADIVLKMKMKKKAKIIEMTTKRQKMWDKDKVLHHDWYDSNMHRMCQPSPWLQNARKVAHEKKGDFEITNPVFATSTNSLIRSKNAGPGGGGSKISIEGKLKMELEKLNVKKTGKYKKPNRTSLENLENLDL